MHGGYAKNIHIFSKTSKNFFFTIIPLLQSISLRKGELIYEYGEIPEDSKKNLISLFYCRRFR
jgi:hypothetical protein